MTLSIPQLIWEPTAEEVAAARVTGFIQTVNDRTGLALSSYDDLWTYSTEDIAGFWAAVAQYFDIRWHQPPASVLDDPTMPGTRWFPDATLNYAEHALRTPDGADENHLAVLSIREDGSQTELTLTELRSEVGAAQAGLRRLGVGPGDRVVALVPNTVHALIGFLATAALGAVWSSCSPDFGADSILDRFIQVEPTVLHRRGRLSLRRKELSHPDETVRQLLDALPLPLGRCSPHTRTRHTHSNRNDRLERIDHTPGSPGVHRGAISLALVDSVLIRHHRTAQTHRPFGRRHPALEHLKSLGLQWDIGPGDLIPVVHDHRLDDVGTSSSAACWSAALSSCTTAARDIRISPPCGELWGTTGRASSGYLLPSSPRVRRLVSIPPRRSVWTPCEPSGQQDPRWMRAVSIGSAVRSGAMSPSSRSPAAPTCAPALCGRAHRAGLAWRDLLPRPGCPRRVLSADGHAADRRGGRAGDHRSDAVHARLLLGRLLAEPACAQLVFRRLTQESGGTVIGSRSPARGSCVIQGRSDATLNRGGIRMGTAEFYRVVEAVIDVDDSLVVDTSSSATGDWVNLLLFVVLDGTER